MRISDWSSDVCSSDLAVRDGNGAVRLVAARGKSRIELDGQADIVAVPAYQLTVGEAAAGMTAGCGYVSDSSLPPRSEGLFKAEITQVDGRSTPLHGINRVHVASGRHVLTIGELIPSHRLSMTQNLHRSRAKQHLLTRTSYPPWVHSQPGPEYRTSLHRPH